MIKDFFYINSGALIVAFCMDYLFGDPAKIPHPICAIGFLIKKTEQKLYKENHTKKALFLSGLATFFIVITVVASVTALILASAFMLSKLVGFIITTLMFWQILAMHSLKKESVKVYDALVAQDLPKARYAVSMIVGRDTQNLTAVQVAKAAIETVAENTCDGVIAPLFYCLLGGPVLGFIYKAINTMDSMLGYKNHRYLYFGRFAAKSDDVVNYLPARISAFLMIISAYCLRGFHGANAVKIWRRDQKNHASPNSAQTESVCAGALGIQLAGDSVYGGKVLKKPFIGDSIKAVSYQDIIKINQLMYSTAALFMSGVLFIFLAVR